MSQASDLSRKRDSHTSAPKCVTPGHIASCIAGPVVLSLTDPSSEPELMRFQVPIRATAISTPSGRRTGACPTSGRWPLVERTKVATLAQAVSAANLPEGQHSSCHLNEHYMAGEELNGEWFNRKGLFGRLADLGKVDSGHFHRHYCGFVPEGGAHRASPRQPREAARATQAADRARRGAQVRPVAAQWALPIQKHAHVECITKGPSRVPCSRLSSMQALVRGPVRTPLPGVCRYPYIRSRLPKCRQGSFKHFRSQRSKARLAEGPPDPNAFPRHGYGLNNERR